MNYVPRCVAIFGGVALAGCSASFGPASLDTGNPYLDIWYHRNCLSDCPWNEIDQSH